MITRPASSVKFPLHYIKVAERSPMGGGDDSAQGFPLFAYCCIPLCPLSTSPKCLSLAKAVINQHSCNLSNEVWKTVRLDRLESCANGGRQLLKLYLSKGRGPAKGSLPPPRSSKLGIGHKTDNVTSENKIRLRNPVVDVGRMI
jgi:hypothetical protein